MVLVEDVTDNASNSSSSQGTSSSSSSSGSRPNTSQPSGTSELSKFIMQDKISAVLCLTRLFSIICTFFFVIPIFGYDSNTLYQKALMSSAATSALKLHQRVNSVRFQLNREYFGRLTVEDSFHYLLYALIFLNTFPITIVLMPIAAFALLHVTVYVKSMINILGGPESFGPIRKVINLITSKDRDIMRFVAVNEIILFPTILVMIFAGKCGIFVPFIYYRFICMRYQSRRNPYNKMMFSELRIAVEYYTSQPNCPQMIRNLTQRLVGIIIRFAPPEIA